MEKLVIYGLTSPLIFKLINAINRRTRSIDIEGIVLSSGDAPDVDRYGHGLLGNASVLPELSKRRDLKFFCNINRSPREMKAADEWLADLGCQTINLIDPGIDMTYAQTGQNVSLAEGCLVGPGARIGHHVTARLGVIISHEGIIEDRVYLGPGVRVCGKANLKEGADIGAGAIILPGCSVGRHTVVGAGAVVTRDLPDRVTAVGVPARIIKHHQPDDTRFY